MKQKEDELSTRIAIIERRIKIQQKRIDRFTKFLNIVEFIGYTALFTVAIWVVHFILKAIVYIIKM